jgi:hypothetical protein
MMRGMDPVADARALIAERFPDASAALLGGGVLSPRRTPMSDLDIVVLLAGPPAPYRESVRFRGWPVELFVHDEQSIRYYLAKEVAERDPTTAKLCAETVVLADHDGAADRIRGEAAALLLAGPPPLTPGELDAHRYGLTDLLDDLAGSTDPGETLVIGWNVFAETALLALLHAGHWLGGGKWLLRELRDLDPDLADRLVAATGDRVRLTQVADVVLARTGGRLWEGYRQAGQHGAPGSGAQADL